MSGRSFFKAVSLVPILAFTGCIATQQDLLILQDDIRSLQKSINSLQQNQADLSVKMEDLSQSLTTLDAQIEESQSGMTQLTERYDSLEFNINQKLDAMTGKLENVQKVRKDRPPNEIYQDAYKDFTQGQYQLAVSGFKAYLDKYPKGAQASKSQYYLGECFYRQEEWDKAADEYSQVLSRYPKSSIAPSARYKKAQCLLKLKKADEAKSLLQSLVREYPKSEEATAARAALEEMGVSVAKPSPKPKPKKSTTTP